MKIVTFYNKKGGVGKTHLNYLVALELVQNLGKKVLYIDADSQANSTVFINGRECKKNTIVDALVNDLDAEDVILKNPMEEYPGLDLIPSNAKMSKMAELISLETAKEKVAIRWFKKNIKTLKKYDYIFIDLAPTDDIVVRNFLFLADSIIPVLKWEDISSLKGCTDFINAYKRDREALELQGDVKIKAVMNCYSPKETTASKNFKILLQSYNDIRAMLLDSKVNNSIAIKNAVMYRMSLRDYVEDARGNTKADLQLKNLTQELIEGGIL